MSETGKVSYFEQVIKEPFMKCTREQKARFALICAIRSLPLLSVKHFKQWERSKTPDYLLSIFTTIDLCAGVLKNIDFYRMNIFQSDIPALYNITKKEIHYYMQNNPNEYKIDSVYAVLDVVSAFRFLSEYFWSFDKGDTLPTALKFQEMKDDEAITAACSVYAAFEKVFTDNNRYLVEKFLELSEDDLSEIRRNDAKDFETDVSIYNGMFTTFLQDLSAIGLGDWANIYNRLFKNKLQFDEYDLSERITDHEKRIAECPRSGEESLMSGSRNVLWHSKK